MAPRDETSSDRAGDGAATHPSGATIGTVKTLTGGAVARHGDGTQVTLHKGDSIFEGDVLVTDQGGAVGVVLSDGTSLSLGEKGRLALNDYAFDAKSHSGDAHLSLESGSFALVSGQIAKTAPDAFALKTPTMTVGIRGTGVAGNANAIALMAERGGVAGEVVVTTPNGQTATLNSAGAAATFGSGGLVQQQLSPLQVMQIAGGAGTALPNGAALLAPAFNAAAQEVQQQQQQQQQPPPPPPPPQHEGETQGPPPGAQQTLTTLQGAVVAQVEQVKKEIAKDAADKEVEAKDLIKTVTGDELPPAATGHVSGGNAAPEVSSSQILSTNQTVYSFTASDFLSHYRDAEGDPLAAIKILTLPQNGTLFLGEEPVLAGTLLAVAEIASLSFVPDWNEGHFASGVPVQFQWIGFDGTAFATVPATLTLGPLQIGVDGFYDGAAETRPVAVTGGGGNDTLIGGIAFDTLIGGGGNDLIVSGTGGGIFDGGGGSDIVSFAQIDPGVRPLTIDLSHGEVRQLGSGEEMPSLFATVSHFETVIGSAYDDVIIGDGSANTLIGGDGADELTGGGGGDTFRYVAASESTVLHHDTITDFGEGDRVEFAGMSGIVYDPAYVPALGASVADTVAAIVADLDVADQAVFFVQDNSGWLYVKGTGSGTSFDGTLIKLEGVQSAPSVSVLSGVDPVQSSVPDGIEVPTGVLASDGSAPAGSAVLDPTRFSGNQLSFAFDVCLSPQLENGVGSLVALVDGNGSPWIDVRVESGQLVLSLDGQSEEGGSVAISTGAWHHLSLSFDGTQGDHSSFRLYLDGVLAKTMSFDASGTDVADTVRGLTVGTTQSDGTFGTAALFDNLGVWNVPRGPHAGYSDQGIVAHWTFNDVGAVASVSQSGAAIPLTLGSGGRMVTYEPPAVREATASGATGTDGPSALGESNAVHLDGSGSAIRSATLFEPGTGDFTVELWARPDTLSETQFLFSKDQSGNSGGWGLYLQNGTLVVTMPGLQQNALTAAVSDIDWHHYAVTRSGLTITLYVDGEVCKSAETDQLVDMSNGIPTLIGGRFSDIFGDSQSMVTPSATESLTGSVSDVRVWSTALDHAQIAAGKDHRLSGAEPDLVEYLPLTPGSVDAAVSSVRDLVDVAVRADGANAIAVTGLPVGTRAVDLSGSASGLVSSTRFEPGTGAFSVELWARADSLAQTSMLFAKDQSDDVTGWSLQLSSDGHLVFAGPDGLTLQSAGVVTAGLWHHYAVTRSGDGELTLYIDGSASGSLSGVTGDFSNGIPSMVGTRLGNNSALQLSLDGAVSEVRVWSVERTAEQIEAGKATRLAGTETGLVDYLPLDGTLTEIVPGETTESHLAHADIVRLGEVQHQAVSFVNGSTASAGTIFNVGAGDFTVELWVNPTASGTLLSKGTALRLALVDGVPTVTLGGTIVVQGDPLTLEGWSHLSLTREGGTYRLYIDGVLNRVVSGLAIPVESADPLTFGGDHFSGLMAGLRLWSVARSEDDILSALHGVSPTGSGLIGAWSGLVDNTASATVTSLHDDSGQGHSLTFANGTNLTDGGDPPLVKNPVEVDGGEPYRGAVVAASVDGHSPTFSLSAQPQHGTLLLGEDGSYVYTPTHGYAGIDSFDITVTTGESQRVQSVALVISPALSISGASQTVTALSFTNNDYATIATASALTGLDDGSFTLEAWIKPDSACLAEDSTHAVLFKNLGQGYFSFRIDNGKLVFQADDVRLEAPTSLTADQWAHVAVTRAGADIALFVNGVQVAVTQIAAYTPGLTLGGDLLVGARPVDGEALGDYFTGQIASVRAWTQALTAAQLAERYNETVDSDSSGLIGAWTGDTMAVADGSHQPTEIASVALPVYGDHIACAYSGSYAGTLATMREGGESGLAPATVTYQWSRVGSGLTSHGGTVTVGQDGSFSYVPAPDWSGQDSFVVRATGSDGQVVTRAVVVAVKPIQPPSQVEMQGDITLSADGLIHLGLDLVDTIAADANQTVSVTLAIDHAAIRLFGTAGVTVTGNGTGLVVLTGTFDRVEAVLNSAALQPSVSDWSGNETLAVTARNLSVDPAGIAVSSTTALPISCPIPSEIVLSQDILFAVGTDTSAPITATLDYLHTAASLHLSVAGASGGTAILSGSALTYTADVAHAAVESIDLSTDNGSTVKTVTVLTFADEIDNCLTGGSDTLAVLGSALTLPTNDDVTIGGVRVEGGGALFVSGAGSNVTIMVGGAVETGGTISVSGGRLTLDSGASLRNGGALTLAGGTIGGTGTLALSSGGSLALRLATELTVALTTAAAAQILIDGGAASASALFDQSFTNAGTLEITAGAGNSAALSVVDTLTNTGTLEVSGDATGAATIAAAALINRGQIGIDQDLTVTAASFDNSASLRVDATLTLRDDSESASDTHQAFVNHGLVAGTGTLDLSDATFDNQSYLSPGGLGVAGALTVVGNLTLGGNSTLALDIGGAASSDRLTVQDGTLTYGGKLIFSILGTPSLETPISVISAPDHQIGGFFSALRGMDNGSVVVDPLFAEHGLSVTLHAAGRIGSNEIYVSSAEGDNDYLIGTGLNESVTLKGGADVFVGHGGGNRIGVSALDFHFIDGGAGGGNELRWDGGANSHFDTTTIRPEALQHFDLLNLSGGGDAVLDYAHVLAMTGETNTYTGTEHTLLVIGAAADHVQLAGSGWSSGAAVNVTVNGHQESYTQYSNAGVSVMVEHDPRTA